MSITSGVYPSRLKTAKLICIHKGGDHKTISNYRPISILPAFGKIIEKVVSTQIYEQFALNNLFTNSQFGFRKGISTENGVSTIIDSISRSFDQSHFVVGVFLDLAKAFDTIDRNILFGKLELNGIKNI